MRRNLMEELRVAHVRRLLQMPSVAQNWPVWKSAIADKTSNGSDPMAIWKLGSELSGIFGSTNDGRTQSSTSGGGYAWEALVCWYLNIVFIGTNVIAFKQSKSATPQVVFDATTVKYGNFPTNTESDLCVISLPLDLQARSPISAISDLDACIRANIGQTKLSILQCKTNWKDNAQIPMLWDIVYRGDFAHDSSIKVGSGTTSIKKFKKFRYGFVTVPTGRDAYKNDTMSVKRLKNLSGGNYWGRQTQDGVASSIEEIFIDQFDDAFPSSITDSISQSIQSGQIGAFFAL